MTQLLGTCPYCRTSVVVDGGILERHNVQAYLGAAPCQYGGRPLTAAQEAADIRDLLNTLNEQRSRFHLDAPDWNAEPGKVWTVYIGSAVDAALRVSDLLMLRPFDPAIPPPNTPPMSHIFGIPLVVDGGGPPRLWRLADRDGTTRAWKEFTA